MKIRDLFFSIVAFGVFSFMSCVYADSLGKDIFVSDAWVQAMPTSATNSAAYMVIVNNSPKEISLVSASSDIAGSTEIHQMSDMDGMMNMAMVGQVHIPAQGKVALQPGGFHVMLIDLKKPLHKGDIVPITLRFQDGSTIIVSAQVKSQ